MARADIQKNIKINLLSSKALLKLRQMKASLTQNIPKLMTVNLKPFMQSLLNIKTSTIALGAALAGFIKLAKDAFSSLALDELALKRLNTSILSMGLTALISGKRIFDWANDLGAAIGLSNTLITNLASRLVDAGINSLQTLQRYTQAIIGLSDHTGQSIDSVTDKLVMAMQGRVQGLRRLGIIVDLTTTKTEALLKVLQKGSQAFADIDLSSSTRSVRLLQTNWLNMMKAIVLKFVPLINAGLQLITKNLNIIGISLLSGSIYAGIKGVTSLFKSLFSIVGKMVAALKLRVKQLTILVARRVAIEDIVGDDVNLQNKLLHTKDLMMRNIIERKTQEYLVLLQSQKQYIVELKIYYLKQWGINLLKSSQFYMLAISIASSVIFRHWLKIRESLTGVSKQMRLIADLTVRTVSSLFKDFSSLIQQLKAYHNLQLTSNEQRYQYNKLIENYNKNIAPKYKTSLLDLKSNIDDINKIIKLMSKNMLILIKTRKAAAIILKSLDTFTKLALKVVKAQQKIESLKQSLSDYFSQAALHRLTVDMSEFEKHQLNIQKQINKQLLLISNYRKLILNLMIRISREAAVFNIDLIIGDGDSSSDALNRLKDNYLAVAKARLLLAKAGLKLNEILLLTMKVRNALLLTVKDIAKLKLLLQKLISRLSIEGTKLAEPKLRVKIFNLKIATKLKINQLEVDRLNTLTNILKLLKDIKLKIDLMLSSLTTKLMKINVKLDIDLLEDPFLGLLALKKISKFKANMQLMTTQIGLAFRTTVQSIPNAFSNMFDKILFEGVKFKLAMKQMLKDLLRQLVSTGIFLLAKTGLGLLTGGIGLLNYPTGFSMPSSSNVVNNVPIYSNRNILRKLDRLILSIDNFVPIQTQVIDLPTLANANSIGNGMIIQGI